MTTDQLQVRFDEVREEAERMLHRQEQQASAEGRSRSAAEQAAVERLVAEARTLKQRINHAHADASFHRTLDRLVGDSGAGAPSVGRGDRLSLGAQFLASDTYRWLRDTREKRPHGQWSSPASELMLMAATITGDPASGGALVVPDYRADLGIVPLATRPLVVADLLAPGTTDSNLVTYMAEESVTNAAASVAEGAAKPESAITFKAVSDAVRKVATWIPVSDEMLEDAPQLRAYLDVRLGLFVQLAEDDQLLNGDGVAPNFLGLRLRPGLAPAIPRGTDTNPDAILKQISAIETTAMLPVDGIVMHPTNWLNCLLLKSTTGEYIASGGPFGSPGPKTLWGRAVAVTPAIVAGTALVGSFKLASQLFRRGGLRVEATNSHADYFIKNLLCVRAESRAALCVYRSAAIGQVTGLN